MKIPFNKPYMTGKELDYIQQAHANRHLSGDGPFTRKCHAWLEERMGCRKVLLTHSCTGALEMAAILADIQPGDEIIMPSYTFVSTANAFVLRGGVPVFVDIRPDTLNMDEKKIEQAISDQTKAIVPVHYAGVPCAMDEICGIADQHALLVIEDAAQAFLSKYKGKPMGTIGHMGTLSFHETKNIISGEGGALLVNHERFMERGEILWEKGTNRKKFFRGEVDKYTWMDVGSSFLPGEMTAAFLYAQLEMSEKIIARRRMIFDLYYKLLEPLSNKERIRLPSVNHTDMSNGHMFYIIAASLEERTRLINDLANKDINVVFHYIPLHSSPAGMKYGRANGNLYHTDNLSERVVRLPLFYDMEDHQVHRVVECIQDFYF